MNLKNKIIQIFSNLKGYISPKRLIAGLIALVILVWVIVGITTARKSVFMPLGFGIAIVTSGSMEPALSVNDIVFVVKKNNYSKDDIIVFEKDGYAVVHRIVIISKKDKTVITRGDANNINDAPIAFSAIKGKAVCSVPYVGAVIRFVKTDKGMISILALAVLAFEVSFLVKSRKSNKLVKKIEQEINELKK